LFSTETCKECDNAFPSIVPNWDHTPRSGIHGIVITETSPANFKKSVEYALSLVEHKPMDKRLIFLKSWNEWAEGNYMEPDRKYGRGFLDALKSIILK
jgi:hypothetical protein